GWSVRCPRPPCAAARRAASLCSSSIAGGAMPVTSIGTTMAASVRRGCGGGTTDDGADLPHLWARVPPRPVVAPAVHCLLRVLAPDRPGAARLTPPLPDLRAA